jgi:hypothetical protein
MRSRPSATLFTSDLARLSKDTFNLRQLLYYLVMTVSRDVKAGIERGFSSPTEGATEGVENKRELPFHRPVDLPVTWRC